jgi:glycosyltransferase involved in cell wall biosynthesis
VGGTAAKALELYRRHGLAGIVRGFRSVALASSKRPYALGADIPGQAISKPSSELIAPRVLIVAELSIPQCTKYRVMQKVEIFKAMGVPCTVISWTDALSCMTSIATHALVIFYRVPAYAHVMQVIEEAKRLKIPTHWEVDDLIFDRHLMEANAAVRGLDHAVREDLLNGADLYRTAMLACDHGIASTIGLRDAMLEAGVPDAIVVENALDEGTLLAAAGINALPALDDGNVRIVYGSGTNTHNVDFAEVAPALLAVMAKYPHVRFRLIGLLELPASFDAYQSRIERISFCVYPEYLRLLAECQISIAPLEKGRFNEAKSNIKFLEASSVGVPSICSRRSAFKSAIRHGVDGMLCDSEQEWVEALCALVEDKALRARLGAAATRTVLDGYHPASIGSRQLAPLLPRDDRAETRRVLTINVLYEPRPFGGATIVAEQINRLLAHQHGFGMYVFTTLPTTVVPEYAIRRYEVEGVTVFGIGMPPIEDAAQSFDNPAVSAAFQEVMEAVRPDLVHLHSVQDIGVTVADVCQQRHVPYVVTAHDAWWVCGRQFMVNRAGKYCRQETIDLNVCAPCVDNSTLNKYRQHRLGRVLADAARIIVPSEYFARFYRHNGFGHVLVNKNGIKRPGHSKRHRQARPLVFGYVGGNAELKGVEVVRDAFRSLELQGIRLLVVDNMRNLGVSSYPQNFFKGVADAVIVPAYTQETIDEFFDQVDVLLFPTQAKESFGLTVREALARNVWVITTDAGGVVEDIIPGENGLIVPFDDNRMAFRQAILDTCRFFEDIPVDAPVQLPIAHLTWFEDQACELSGIYATVLDEQYEKSKTSEGQHMPKVHWMLDANAADNP